MSEIYTDMRVLENVVAFNLDVNLWTARKKLLPEDMGGVSLPPEELATLGSKRIAPPESLKVFTTLKARAVSLLDRYGIRFIGGWAVPVNSVDAIIQEMQNIRDEFVSEKENFLQQYDKLISEWLDTHENWREWLENSIVSPEYVKDRLQFKWQLYRVSVAGQMPDSGLQEQVEQLGSTLFTEIAKTANDIWNKVYLGKNMVTHKALSPLKTLERKLMGLTFIEPHVAPVAMLIHTTLENMPLKGNIVGNDLISLQGLVCLLKDTKSLLAHTDSLIKTNVAEELPMAAYVELSTEQQSSIEEVPRVLRKLPVIADSMGLW